MADINLKIGKNECGCLVVVKVPEKGVFDINYCKKHFKYLMESISFNRSISLELDTPIGEIKIDGEIII